MGYRRDNPGKQEWEPAQQDGVLSRLWETVPNTTSFPISAPRGSTRTHRTCNSNNNSIIINNNNSSSSSSSNIINNNNNNTYSSNKCSTKTRVRSDRGVGALHLDSSSSSNNNRLLPNSRAWRTRSREREATQCNFDLEEGEDGLPA